MRVNNQSSSTVNWTQGGTNPQPAAAPPDNSGTLTSGQKTEPFNPSGNAPWVVTFSNGHEPVSSPEITKPGAEVTLNDDWTVSVS